MGLFVAIIVGLFVGMFFGWLMKGSYDLLFMNALLGLVGSILGLAVYYIAAHTERDGLFSLAAVLCEAVGAMIIVGIFQLLQKAAPDPTDTDLE